MPAAWVLAAACAAGCFTTRAAGDAMQARLDGAERAQAATEAALATLRAEERAHVEATLVKLGELSQALAHLGQSARVADADFGTQMEQMVQDLRELRGAVETNEHRLGESASRLEEDFSARLEAVAKNKLAEDKVRPSRSRRQIMKEAREATARGDVQAARQDLQAALKASPRAAGVADEALYLLGDGYLAEDQPALALKALIEVVERFPKGAWADDATFKIGVASERLGRTEDARAFYTSLLDRYPTSPWCGQARARLRAMRGKGQPARGATTPRTTAPTAPRAPGPQSPTPPTPPGAAPVPDSRSAPAPRPQPAQPSQPAAPAPPS